MINLDQLTEGERKKIRLLEQQANAQLIAAAPMLFRALKDLMDWRNRDPEFVERIAEWGNQVGSDAVEQSLYDVAKMAIRKAEEGI